MGKKGDEIWIDRFGCRKLVVEGKVQIHHQAITSKYDFWSFKSLSLIGIENKNYEFIKYISTLKLIELEDIEVIYGEFYKLLD